MKVPRRTTVIAAVVFAQVVGAGVYALAGPPSETVGQAVVPVSGSEATDVSYVLDTADPMKVTAVTFTSESLPQDPEIKIQLSEGGQWFDCAASGSLASCDTPGTSVESVTVVNLVISG